VSEQIYCTLGELIADLKLPGDEPRLFERIQAASAFIARRVGNFLPMTAARDYDAALGYDVRVDPLLALTAISNNGVSVTLSDCSLYPLSRYWDNGPYTRIHNELVSWDEVTATGRWGLYEETAALGETVTQLIADTTLAVADGASLSPGMVVLVESEQELVTAVGSATTATSKLNGALDEAEEEIDVDNGAEFNRGEVIQLSTEDCCIRMVRGNTLVCSRGWNGTTKIAHLDDAAIGVYRTYTVKRAANGATATAHTSKAAYRYVVPADVNWLVREMAGLMREKAAHKFAGRIDNAADETLFINEFPSQIKEIKKNYRITQV
jgi:hypothetical protein